MFRGQFVRPMEITPRNQPAGTLTENGSRSLPRDQAAVELHNPLTANPRILTKGKQLFMTDCSPCHGRDGKGDGSVLPVLALLPANLTAGMPTKVSDGYIFSTIRNGGMAMPPYGDTLSAHETWELVLYVRHLQNPEFSRDHETHH
ncbi:MAG TPA: c-type cytochrome [Candidatus Binataceae bacterium]|nr:c-type cytochrome [Candidatus Binataceae bacterium]